MNGNNTTILKKANKYLIIASIRRYEAVTIENLIDITGLSRPTVRNILDELLESQLVESVGYAKAEIGRQPTLYRLNIKLNYAIGIDIELAPIRVMFTDLGGNVVYKKSWSQGGDGTEEDLFNNIMDVINEGIEVLGISSDNIVGVGMGVPGLIDINRNVITHIPRLPSLYESQIAKRIEDEMGIRVYVCNDVKLIALADSQVADANYENMLYVAYRCGIGMAILHKQDIYNGEYGNSGYLGHTTIDPAGDLCSCGNHGCLELYCSRAVLIKKYNGMGTDHIDTFGELLALADDGSRDAQEVLGWGGRYLGIAIANAVKLFDISVVMIGDLCDNMECYYFKVIKQAVKDCTIYMGDRDITFLLGSNEEDNYAIGGCRFVIEKFFRSPKLRLQSNE